MKTVDREDLIPRTQTAFRVDQIATQIFSATVEHIYTLIKEGEIVVPKERIDSAASRSCILVPRESLVDFCRRRSAAICARQRKPKSTKRRRRRPVGGRK